MSTAPPWTEITTVEELRDRVGEPAPRIAAKVRDRLEDLDRRWIAASPFLLLATADEHGRCDVSPKGDVPGAVRVLDDRTLAVPDRLGNRRVDGWLNVLRNPHAGLLFLVPGRGDTLRVNGRARLLSDADFFDDLAVRGRRPELVLLLSVQEVFFHCAKAFLRSGLWEPETWPTDGLPSRAEIAHRLERPDTPLPDLERYYGPGYGGELYNPA